MVWRLTDNPSLFPDPRYGDDDGLIAIGGDLSPERLTVAYMNGIFPWYGFKEEQEIMWWCPMQRFVIFPEEIHISHSMKQLMKKGTYHMTVSEAFDKVIEGCGKQDARNTMRGAWLGDDMTRAYTKMYELGLAVSVEVWSETKPEQNDTQDFYYQEGNGYLVGGLYGINIGVNFFGESMFSKVPNASKLALIFLAQLMKDTGGIIDCQFETPHLKTMGGRHIPYDEYMGYLIEPAENGEGDI